MQKNYLDSIGEKLNWLEGEGYYLWFDEETGEWELNKEKIVNNIPQPDEKNWCRLFGRSKFAVIEQGWFALTLE
jgi:hypothetical protein